MTDSAQDHAAAELATLRSENRRLRAILDGIARAGLGQGALLEVFEEAGRIQIVLCRADVDEVAFANRLSEAIHELAEVFGDVSKAVVRRVGVTADETNTDAVATPSREEIRP